MGNLSVPNSTMQILIDDLSGPEIKALLENHLHNMTLHSPPESRHVLDLNKLKDPKITFWTVWENTELLGCGALKRLNDNEYEIKSMKTADQHLRKGVAKKMLEHIICYAEKVGCQTLLLETGSMLAFEPAKKLYRRYGFELCEPFADYKQDPNSIFMCKHLS
jgi:putative acetyltransferase